MTRGVVVNALPILFMEFETIQSVFLFTDTPPVLLSTGWFNELS